MIGHRRSRWHHIALSISILASLAGPSAALAQKWEKLERCRFLSSGGNDGDSFHVSHDGKTYIFRLYFVDAPEISESYPDRVAAQAVYFRLNEKETLKVGSEAAEFTRKFLDGGTFTVFTCWEDAKGESELPRQYAIIDKGSESLIEELIEAGLARIYGMPAQGADSPLGSNADRYVDTLRRLERDAQRAKAGGWRKSSRVDPPVVRDTPPVIVNSPTPSIRPLTPSIRPLTPTIPSSSGPLVNVNTASAAQLEAIPGIGPTLSSRLISARPFSGPRDLLRVNGIGEKTLVKLAPYLNFDLP
jgi:endonuclease YncB( thermonuclease family)